MCQNSSQWLDGGDCLTKPGGSANRATRPALLARPCLLLALPCLLLAGACSPEPASGPGLRLLASGLDVPESVVHDAARDRYLVSCVGGRDDARDGNGAIVAVDPESGVVTAFAESGLDAPKGLALLGAHLVVADLTRLVVLRLADGAVAGVQPIEGARFLNDVAASADGRLALSDTRAGRVHVLRWREREAGVGFEPEALHEVPAPNGLAWEASGGAQRLVVASWQPGDLGWVTAEGGFRPLRWSAGEEPAEGKDGLVAFEGRWFFSNFLRGSVASVRPEGSEAAGAGAQLLARGLEAPADLGLDEERRLLLVPAFRGGRLYTLPLAPAEPGVTGGSRSQ